AFVQLVGEPEELLAEEWQSFQFRSANVDALFYFGSEAMKERSMMDLFLEGQRLGLTITPILDLAAFMADPHVKARSIFHTVNDPDLGAVQLPRPPYRLGERREAVQLSPAPGLGQHSAVAAAFAKEPRTAARPAGPAAGLTSEKPL